MAIIAAATGDLDLAEDSVQDAVATALERWPVTGTPRNPQGWLVAVARHRAIDQLRRRAVHARAIEALAAVAPDAESDEYEMDEAIPDERLALISACCHPALGLEAQVALTLRLAAGLSTEDIARAFLVPTATMGQRIARAKAKVRDAGIPVRVPDREALPERLDAVLAVVYLVFNQGYGHLDGAEAAREAIGLGRVLTEVAGDTADVHGLLALMLLQESRRAARSRGGELVVLDQQDRSAWDTAMIEEGLSQLRRAMRAGPVGAYTVQAAIAACHAVAPSGEATDWRQIVALYGWLDALTENPVVVVNRAAAMTRSGDPEGALDLLDTVVDRLGDFYAFHAARGDALERLGRGTDASAAFSQAAHGAPTEEERLHLRERARALAG